MTFEQQLHAVIVALGPAQHRTASYHDGAAALVAVHAPHLLKRFAILAGALQSLPPTGGQGIILACRNGPLGYRTVEYRSRDLHLVLDATEREACFEWDANGETRTYVITPDTTTHDLDRAILDAVAAFVRAQTPVETVS